MTGNDKELRTEVCISGRSVIAILPARFGHLGEILSMQQGVKDALEAHPEATEIVLDFGLVVDLEPSFPSRIEKFVARTEDDQPNIAVCWQNVGDSVRGFVESVAFGRGSEKDPPVMLNSSVLGEGAMTSSSRLEQNDIDDLFASLGR